jgi:3-dehydroquinate dehydratase/shikimate dehydrogenase
VSGHLVVTVFERTHQAARRRLRALPAAVDLVELRLDALDRPEPERLIAAAPRPVIATCRSGAAAGGFRGGEAERIALLARAARGGAAYVDVEWHSAAVHGEYGRARRIVSLHLDRTPRAQELMALAGSIGADADVVKLIPRVESTRDLIETLAWMRSARGTRPPWIAFGAGRAGIPTRWLALALGSWAVYLAAPGGRPAAAGQIGIDELLALAGPQRLRSARRFYAIFGRPLAHSLSPRLHNRLLDKLRRPALYLPIEADGAADCVALCRTLPIDGASVTVPFKREVLRHLDIWSARAERIGAVNTIVRRGARLVGDNTDAPALLAAVRAPARLRGRRCLILGAGGAARAAAFALSSAGAVVTVSNRTAARARELAREVPCEWVAWRRRTEVEAQVVVNATSIGMTSSAMPLTEPRALRGRIVVDLVYRAGETAWVRHARRCGAKRAQDGLEILLRQAAEQARLFHRRPIRWTSLRSLLK